MLRIVNENKYYVWRDGLGGNKIVAIIDADGDGVLSVLCTLPIRDSAELRQIADKLDELNKEAK